MKKFLEKLFLFDIAHDFDDEDITTVERLKMGNTHFTSYMLQKSSTSNIERVRYLALNGQNPHAVIVTCSDARISPERIFNAEMGDFFIIRTAGNVIGELELGSIEYAVSTVRTDTIIVMGHENCGAIHSTIEHKCDNQSGNIRHIMDMIQPSIDKAASETDNHTEIIARAENYNIMNAVEKIKTSLIVQQAIAEGKLTVIGAKYGIATGKVTFFETENKNIKITRTID